MRRILFILMIMSLASSVMAQPQSRRQQAQQQQKAKSNANNITTRAQVSFPTAATMSEDVVWRRDIYREMNLEDESNAGLYYPVEPMGNQMNLFTYLFKLLMHGNILGVVTVLYFPHLIKEFAVGIGADDFVGLVQSHLAADVGTVVKFTVAVACCHEVVNLEINLVIAYLFAKIKKTVGDTFFFQLFHKLVGYGCLFFVTGLLVFVEQVG